MLRIPFLVFVFLLLHVSCDNPEPTPDPKKPDVTGRGPAPAGMQKLSVSIDSKYNLEGAKVMSLFDSTSVIGNKFILYVPSNFTSQVFVSDEGGDKIFATVDTHPGDTVAILNAKSVSVSLLDLLPAYAALDSAQAIQVATGDFTRSEVFSNFQMAVDVAMQNKTDLWDVEASNLIEPLKAVSQSLVKKYFTLTDTEGGRFAATTEIDKWLIGSPKENAKVGNPVYSWAQVNLQAIKTNSSSEIQPFILAPRDMENDGNPKELTKLRKDISHLPDHAYDVTVTQKSDIVRNKNAERLGLSILSFLIGKIIDHQQGAAAPPQTEGSTQDNCLRDVSKAVVDAVKKNTLDLVMSTKLVSVGEVVEAVMATVKESFFGVIEAKSCLKLSTRYGSKTFIKLIGKRVMTALNVYEKIETYAEFRHSVMSFITPEELTDQMQLHHGRLLTGRVELTQAKKLEEVYQFEETIYPSVKLAPFYSYRDVEMEGLLVQWKVKEGHGSLNLQETKLDKNGETVVGWKLPKVAPNADGEVELNAEIRDKEREHIKGSPITFKVKVHDSWIKILAGRWTIQKYFKLSDEKYEFYTKMYNDNIANNPCGMGFILIGNDPVLGSNTLLWNEPTITEEVEFREDYTAILYQEALKSKHPSNVCTKRPNGSVPGLWRVSGTGYIKSLFEGQLVRIDDNTYHVRFTSCMFDATCNPANFVLKRI